MPESSAILLVDDSRVFLTIEKQFLKNTPAVLLEAQSAEQVLELCSRRLPDLIYMACELQGTSGIECCRQLKADPRLRAIPVILICDGGGPEQEELCRRAGGDAMLTKPLDRRRFLEIGRSFLAGIRETRRLCLFRVRCRSGERHFSGKGLDISSGGLFLETSGSLTTGEELQLEIQLSRPDQEGPWIRCSGVVSWTNSRENTHKPGHPPGFGVKFTEMPNSSAAVLNGFLRSLDAR